jgi:hypothetical protein
LSFSPTVDQIVACPRFPGVYGGSKEFAGPRGTTDDRTEVLVGEGARTAQGALNVTSAYPRRHAAGERDDWRRYDTKPLCDALGHGIGERRLPRRRVCARSGPRRQSLLLPTFDDSACRLQVHVLVLETERLYDPPRRAPQLDALVVDLARDLRREVREGGDECIYGV